METSNSSLEKYKLPWNQLIAEIDQSSYREVLSLLTASEVKDGITLERVHELENKIYDKEITVPQTHKKFLKQINRFYNHPVWLLSGIWHESSEEAIKDRLPAVELLCHSRPETILDFGGGIGMVARLIYLNLPSARIDIVDISTLKDFTKQHLKKYKNICVLDEPDKKYDGVISTETLEHCLNPFKEIVKINRLLKMGGIFVATWCFTPCSSCHIIMNFYLQNIFDKFIALLGFKFIEKRGRAYKFTKTRDVNLLDALFVFILSSLYKSLYKLIYILKAGIRGHNTDPLYMEGIKPAQKKN